MITPEMDIENVLDIVMAHIKHTLDEKNIEHNNARLIAYNELLIYGVDKFHENDSNITVSTLVENTINSIVKHNIC